MLKNRLMLIPALLLVLLSTTAHAFFDLPQITPARPVAGELVPVVIHGGVCDTIVSRQGYPQITCDGNSIRILEYGQHWDPGELCTFPIGTLEDRIGTFPPGAYTLTVDLFYLDFFSRPQILTLGIVPFTVARAAPPAVPAPTTSPLGLLALILALLALTASVLGGRRTG